MALIAAAAGVAKTAGSIAGKIVKIFGGGQKTGPQWNRMQPITVGEALTSGGAAVDAAYQAKINIQWRSDLSKTWDTIVRSNVVWSTIPNPQPIYEAARAAHPEISGVAATATSAGAMSASMASFGKVFSNPIFLIMLAVVGIGTVILIRTRK